MWAYCHLYFCQVKARAQKWIKSIKSEFEELRKNLLGPNWYCCILHNMLLNYFKLFYSALNLTAGLLCFALFVWLMHNIWTKYETKSTYISLRSTVDIADKKSPPCITACPFQAFRTTGSITAGRCYMVCAAKKLKKGEWFNIYFKRTLDIKGVLLNQS